MDPESISREKNSLLNKKKSVSSQFCFTKNFCVWMGVIICLAICAGVGCLLFYGYCELFTSTYDGCWCNTYNYNTQEIQTCLVSINRTSNILTCQSRFGYWTCDADGKCPMADKHGDRDGWGNCVFTKSDTNNSPIATCDTYIFGREICFESTKTCCWYTK